MNICLLIHLAATLFMTGLIWFVQIVHYPLFSSVGHDHFTEYENRHRIRTTWVVAPMMLTEVTTAVLLLYNMKTTGTELVWSGIVLLFVIWLCTAGLSVPAHGKLAQEFSVTVHKRLVVTNWIRTIAWSIRAGVALAMVYQALPSVS